MILWYSLICSYCVRCRVPTQKMEDTKRSGTEHMISWFALRRLKCCNRCGKCYLTSKCMLAFRKGKTWRRRKDAIWWYLSMYIIIEGSERPMAKNMIHACRWFISCGLLKSLPLVFLFFFFFRGIQCQTKARSKTCSFSCQRDWWSKTRAPRGKISKSQLLDLLLAIYQPPVSWLRWPTWAPTKGCDQRLSQTSFADVYRQSSCLTTVTTF